MFSTSYAYATELTNLKCHKQWCSGILKGDDGTKKNLRMFTTSVSYQASVMFVLDFSVNADGFVPVLFLEGKITNICRLRRMLLFL